MERDVAQLDCRAEGISRGELSSVNPVYDARLPSKGALDRIAAYLAALGFREPASRHELVREISERLASWPGDDLGEETIEGRVIQATLDVVDRRLARVPGLGGRPDGSIGALGRVALADPRVVRACLASRHARQGLREYDIPFPESFITPPIPPSLPTSMPEQRLDTPSLKGQVPGWRGWLRFHAALRTMLAKISR